MISFLDPSVGPLFGLTANVAPAPFSVLISLILILGVDYFGLILLRRHCFLNDTEFSWLRWQSICVGSAVLGMVLYPLALFGFLSRFIAQFLALPLLIIGVYHGISLANNFICRFLDSCFFKASITQIHTKFIELIFHFFLLGYIALSLSPITEADSLDYHVGVALHILNMGSFPFSPEWFHSRLAGSGETLIALGLSMGAEQFGALLQCSGIIGISGILRHFYNATTSWRYVCIFGVLSAPIFIAWAASPKPLLLPISMTTAALTLAVVVFCSNKKYSGQLNRNAFSLICILIMTAAVTKMNFLMSGFVVGIVALILMIKNGNSRDAFFLGFMFFFIIMVPPAVWKHIHYGGSIISGFIHPFPGGWIGTEEFEKMLRTYRDTYLFFPLSLVIPTSFGTITTVIGFGMFISIIGLLIVDKPISQILVYSAISVFILGIILGQKNARFFMEPFIWLMLAALIHGRPRSSILNKIFFFGVTTQSFFTFGLLIMGIYSLSLGAFTKEQRDAVMRRHSMTYLEMEWVDNVLPKDAKVIIRSRFMATVPRYSISSDWMAFVPFDYDEKIIYRELTSTKNPEFIIFSLDSGTLPNLDRCEGYIYAGPFRSQIAVRNPFNVSKPYDVYIVRLPFPRAYCIL